MERYLGVRRRCLEIPLALLHVGGRRAEYTDAEYTDAEYSEPPLPHDVNQAKKLSAHPDMAKENDTLMICIESLKTMVCRSLIFCF